MRRVRGAIGAIRFLIQAILLRLAPSGADVAVFEAQPPGWGASGRNGGFCCLGGFGAPDSVIAKLHGEDARAEARRAEMAAVETAADLIEHHNLQVDRHSDGETVMGFTPKSLVDFETNAKRSEE